MRTEYISYVRSGGGVKDKKYTRNDMKSLTAVDLKLFDQPKMFKRHQSVSIPGSIFNRHRYSLSMIVVNISDHLPVYIGGDKQDFKTYTTTEDEVEASLMSGDLAAIIDAFRAYCKSGFFFLSSK